jgi:ABC transporter substrate binding protein
VDVIATYSIEHAIIAKRATTAIPIVATLLGDPLGTGLVNSLARPGGNLTGLSAQNADLTGKRFEVLREVVPNLRRLAVLYNGNNPVYRLEVDIVRAAAIPLGLASSHICADNFSCPSQTPVLMPAATCAGPISSSRDSSAGCIMPRPFPAAEPQPNPRYVPDQGSPQAAGLAPPPARPPHIHARGSRIESACIVCFCFMPASM